MTIQSWLKKAEEELTASGCPDPAIDARWIAEDTLNMSASDLRFEGQSTLSDEKLDALNTCLDRRIAGEPVQYILNRADFMGLKFFVDQRVLIPRQDTETLTESVIVELQPLKSPKVLDLCCGSGCIGISIASLVPHAVVTMSDISEGAVEVTKKNAKELEVDVTVKHGDLFSAVADTAFDLIVSNPPYIPTPELSELQREVRFEPELALDGGQDGLDIYRRIAEEASAHLGPHGRIYLEVGIGEADAVLALLRKHIPCEAGGIIKDLCGIDRIVWVRSK